MGLCETENIDRGFLKTQSHLVVKKQFGARDVRLCGGEKIQHRVYCLQSKTTRNSVSVRGETRLKCFQLNIIFVPLVVCVCVCFNKDKMYIMIDRFEGTSKRRRRPNNTTIHTCIRNNSGFRGRRTCTRVLFKTLTCNVHGITDSY